MPVSLKREIKIFFTALMFYTRLPCPKWTNHEPDMLNKASRYFPLIGWIVGAIMAFVFQVTFLLFDSTIAILMSMLSGVLVTGAFHEDGLADAYDGFGGGWTKLKILDIMKDSRVGTYGATALFFLYALKFATLSKVLMFLEPQNYSMIYLVFICYHALARFVAISIVFTEVYSRDDASSKVKPIATTVGIKDIVLATFFGLLPLVVLSYFNIKVLLVLLVLLFLRQYSVGFFNKWIKGYTGDCLGAVEQIAEVFILLGFSIIWKFF